MECAHFIEGHLERVEEMYQRGLRHLQLLHDHDMVSPLGDTNTGRAPWRFDGVRREGTDNDLLSQRTGAGTNRAWPGLTGGFFNVIVGEMLRQGFTAGEISKVGGGNYCPSLKR